MVSPRLRPSFPLVLALIFAGTALASAAATLSQPVAPVRSVTDEYFGTRVVDPYRWMESEHAELTTWLGAQGAYTTEQLARVPGRDKLHARIRELDRTRMSERARFAPLVKA